jgi:beta-phosphoglucomutase-like phosphatase (HAD superfamily)
VTVSSEEVAHGKPAPDVYVEAARRLGVAPKVCVAVEDSTNGIRSAATAGMRVIAVPNAEFPPAADAVAQAAAVVTTVRDVTVELVEAVSRPQDA